PLLPVAPRAPARLRPVVAEPSPVNASFAWSAVGAQPASAIPEIAMAPVVAAATAVRPLAFATTERPRWRPLLVLGGASLSHCTEGADKFWSFPYACEVSCRVRAGLPGPSHGWRASGFTPRPALARVAGVARVVPPLLPEVTTRRDTGTAGRIRRSIPVLSLTSWTRLVHVDGHGKRGCPRYVRSLPKGRFSRESCAVSAAVADS